MPACRSCTPPPNTSATLDVPAYIYHFGDFDPSGVNAGEKIEQTLRELAPTPTSDLRARSPSTPSRSATGSCRRGRPRQSDSRAKGFGGDIGRAGRDRSRSAARPGAGRHRATPAARPIRGYQGRRGKRAAPAGGLGRDAQRGRGRSVSVQRQPIEMVDGVPTGAGVAVTTATPEADAARAARASVCR